MGRFMLAVCILCGNKESKWNSGEFKHRDFCPKCVKKHKLKLQQYQVGIEL